MSHTSGTSEQVLSLPKGGGAVQGLGEKFQPDLHSGTGSYAIPLDIPNGPNDVAPALTLLYHTAGGNGPFGMGFSLNLFAISRSTDRRVPAYGEEDTLILAGGGELVPVAAGKYRLRVDANGWQFTREGQGFTILDRDGRTYRLGHSEQARLFTEEGPQPRILSWHLEEVEDNLGNKVSYQYQRDSNQLYLQRIAYSIYTIDFVYESRPDPILNGRAGFLIGTRQRCKAIELRVNTLAEPLTRRWTLGYQQSEPGNHSLLQQLRLTGFGEGGAEAESPVLTLGYSSFQTRTLERFQAESPDAHPGAFANGRRELIDWYGDGLPDLMELGEGSVRVWRNLGDCTWARPRSLSSGPTSLALNDPGVAFADMDGSGTADLISLTRLFAGYYPHLAGGAFGKPVFWPRTPGVSLADPNARLVDLNGDGLTDLLVTGDQYFSLYYRDAQNGWTEKPQTVSRGQAPAVSLHDPRTHLADMTGDGFQDLVRVDGRGITFWPYLGLGRWAAPVTLENPPGLPRNMDPNRLYLNDVDGDGRADLIYVDLDRVFYWINQGNRLSDRREILYTPACQPEQIRLADMKGSGTAGVLWAYTGAGNRKTEFYYLDFTGQGKPYLLTRIDNGMGLSTTITYGTSSQESARDKDAGRPWTTFLPFPVVVITGIHNVDQATQRHAVSRYRYHEGHYDGDSREFCGFAGVEAEEQGDESVPTMRTLNTFHIGLDPADLSRHLTQAERDRLRTLRGKLLRAEIYGLDGSPNQGRPYMQTENDWSPRVLAEAAGVEILFPHLTESRELHLERQATPFRIKTTRNLALDAFANITDQEEVASDPRDAALTRSLRTGTTFVADPAGRFLSKPQRVEQRDESGQVVAATISYYDNLPMGQVGAQGLLTRQETLVLPDNLVAAVYGAAVPDFAALGYHRRPEDEGWWINKLEYARTDDAEGLRGSVTNPRGQVSSLFYDAGKIHPVKLTDARGNTTETIYDYRANKVRSLKDPNAVTITHHYDPLGRLTATVEPGATEALPTLQVQYATDRIPVVVTTRQRAVNGKSEVVSSRVFLDGAGQIIEGRMGTNGTEVVDQSQLFSSRGTVKRQYLPYQPPSPDFVPAPEALPHKSLFYDALGRLIRIENADGTFVEQAFEPGTAFLFDEEDVRVDAGAAHAGTPRRHIYDPTGRIQEVALNQEGSWLPTRYVYDVKGNLLLEESPTGQQTTFAYDFLGRRLQTQSAATGKTVFVFDANGNQVSKSDSGAEVVNFEFDELDRLKRTVYRDTGEVAAAYLYHDTSGPAAPEAGPFSKGRLVKVNYPDGELVFGYDAMGNVIRKTIRPASLPGQDLVFDYTFRADGKVDSILYPAPAPGGGRMLVRYEYNQRGLLLRVPGYVSTIAYNPAGQRTSITFGNGVVSAYGYEEASFRLLSLHTGNGGGEVLQDLQYQYDQTGNVLAVLSPDPKRAARFVYDDLYQLIQATTEAGLSWSYAYDEESNLTQKSDVGAYGYDAAGRLTSAGAGVFSYTATGQMAAAPWGNCTYDPSGRLRKIVKGAEEMSCHYDQDGRRTRVQVTGGAADYAFLTPDELVSIENGTVFAYLMDGPVRFAQIRLDSNAVSYLHGDHLSSTSVVTGPAGQVLQQVYYDPFGGILENSLAAGTPGAHHLYAGQVLDAWSGLVYLHSRYYHAGLGRFTSPDNLVPELYQPQAWNRYCYVQNNPMRFIDPTGHFWEEIGDWFEDNWQNIVAAVVAVIVIIAVVVLTIVTFGAAALIGVGIAMAIGGIIGGISAGVAGGDILTGILVGMAVGGLAAFGGMGIGAGMAAVFGKGTFLAAVATGALSGAVSGAAMGFAAGFAGGQGSAGEIWERVWQGALVGAVSGAILGVGSGLFKAGVLGSGKLGFATLTKESLIKAGTGFLAGGAAELGRQYASGKSTDQLEWGKILGAGAGGAALGSFVKFGGNSGLPILDFLKPEYVGISSSIFAMLPSGVFVLGYADDLWNLLKSNEAKTPDIKGSF